MEHWDGAILDINATCDDLGPKYLQLFGMHALSGCDTTSYPYGKGRIGALKTLLAGNFPGLADVLGEVGATEADLLEAAKPFFLVLYDQPPRTSIESARTRVRNASLEHVAATKNIFHARHSVTVLVKMAAAIDQEGQCLEDAEGGLFDPDDEWEQTNN
ncbi:hypothetical protein Pcinc_020220 [Petrolisthes cinctipes]|uniref:Uncharacterized protein n=1 Tax=Petrolisthes cinctipes TaxID=88211 RepID=A0AAE1FIN5_PETCI|nr:hypothetical protein Pcinc_020220 [Petrolisthes cinctipes]